MEFKTISVYSAGLFFVLFLCLLGIPGFVLLLLGVESDASAEFIARRAAFLFLGLAILLYFGRAASHCVSRQAVLMGLISSMVGLALLGCFEFMRGFAGPVSGEL